MLYPVPAVMVTTLDQENKPNILTVAWAGTVCSDPVMVSISVKPKRYSYQALKDNGEFVINLVSEDLTRAADTCGVRTGAKVDKFKLCGLTIQESQHIRTPGIAESPVNIECKVRQIIPLGVHDLFIAEVVGVSVDDRYLDDQGKLDLAKAKLIAYSHGEYRALGRYIGTFGYSVKKHKTPRKQPGPRKNNSVIKRK